MMLAAFLAKPKIQRGESPVIKISIINGFAERFDGLNVRE